jgi:hypothetical protein
LCDIALAGDLKTGREDKTNNMSTLPWLFLSELFLIGAIWFFITELNNNFGERESLGRAMHDKVLRETTPENKSIS